MRCSCSDGGADRLLRSVIGGLFKRKATAHIADIGLPGASLIFLRG
jgi:hypothetical protein